MEKVDTKNEKYIEAVGRRKTAVARVRITPASKTTYQVNGKELHVYFPVEEMQIIAKEALADVNGAFKVTVQIVGGGIHSQSEAMRHALARSLVKFNSDLRRPLKQEGMLKRDPRMKERRKFGLKKARKAPQWSKR